MTPHREDLLNQLESKYATIDQKTDTHLEGLLWSKPMTYWDYVQTDALLNLQVQRTTLPRKRLSIKLIKSVEENSIKRY